MTETQVPSKKSLKRAIVVAEQIESLQSRLQEKQAELQELLGTPTETPTVTKTRKPRKPMSEEAKARMSAKATERWARVHAEQAKAQSATPTKEKGTTAKTQTETQTEN